MTGIDERDVEAVARAIEIGELQLGCGLV